MCGRIGVLALQGAYQKHADMLASMGVESRLVKTQHALDTCAGLVIPGGESTTMSLLIENAGLYDAIKGFAQHKPVMGVCAGMVLMANKVLDARVAPLGIMPLTITRNYYGRQLDSFSAHLPLRFDVDGPDYSAHFIRAPAASEFGDALQVLAEVDNTPVMLAMGQHLAVAFHPELTSDSRIHQYWIRGFEPSRQ